MKKLLIILILQSFATGKASSQSFTVDDLVTLASLQSKNVDRFMNRSGFVLSCSNIDSTIDTDSTIAEASFIVNAKVNKKDIEPKRTIDMYLKNNSKYFNLYTSSADEYLEGQRSLIKSGFSYDNKNEVSKESSILFQKGNITIKATSVIKAGIAQYAFKLKEREIPSAIMYAEELLQFDSHEFLASFFGAQNVKKDLYYFSEKELKKCSVLFSGTRRQAVFVWGDENNLSNLSYILVSNVLPTAGAEKNNPLTGNNEWQFQSGIHPGMAIKDLLKINEMDFEIYGNESELAFMIKPVENGKIDFNKTAICLSCINCVTNKIFNQKVVSALDVAKANLPMRVCDVIIYPSFF